MEEYYRIWKTPNAMDSRGEDIETFCMELELSLMLAEDERKKWEQGMEAT